MTPLYCGGSARAGGGDRDRPRYLRMRFDQCFGYLSVYVWLPTQERKQAKETGPKLPQNQVKRPQTP